MNISLLKVKQKTFVVIFSSIRVISILPFLRIQRISNTLSWNSLLVLVYVFFIFEQFLKNIFNKIIKHLESKLSSKVRGFISSSKEDTAETISCQMNIFMRVYAAAADDLDRFQSFSPH